MAGRGVQTFQDVLARAEWNGDCLVWMKCRSSDNYGSVWSLSRKGMTGAHRVAYELFHGVSLETEEHLLHACDNPPCVNPEHLRIGTHAENMRDAADKGHMKAALHPKKLTLADVAEIRARFWRKSERKTNAIQLAAEYGVTPTNIHLIVKGQIWPHWKTG